MHFSAKEKELILKDATLAPAIIADLMDAVHHIDEVRSLTQTTSEAINLAGGGSNATGGAAAVPRGMLMKLDEKMAQRRALEDYIMKEASPDVKLMVEASAAVVPLVVLHPAW